MNLVYGFKPLEGETFKNVPVEGYENKYRVSNFGRVLSLESRTKELYVTYGYDDTQGYKSVNLRNGKGKTKTIRVHILVARAFLPEREIIGRKEVNHKDGNKHNNYLENLEWASSFENSKHAVDTGLFNIKGSKHPHAKLTEAQVLEIRQLYHTKTHKEIALLYGMDRRQIGAICNGINWGHLPLEDYSNKPNVKYTKPNRRKSIKSE